MTVGVDVFNILLDNDEQGVYYAGQVVMGRIQLTLTSSKKIRGHVTFSTSLD